MDKSQLIKVIYHLDSHISIKYIELVASYNVMWKKVIENCPHNHQTNNLEMFWIDEEKDKIVIDSKESFNSYLSYTLGLSPKYLHVRESNANTKTKKTTNKSYNSVVHDNIECDGCYMFPIVGHMYKCLECANYDLCQDCVLNKIHMNHDMLQISTNNSPRAVEAHPSTSSTSENKKKSSSSPSQNPVNANNSIKSNVSNNASEDEESSSSWEEASDDSDDSDDSDVSSDEDKKDMNNANPNSCLISKYHKMLWSFTKFNPRMWWTSDEDKDSDSCSWKTIDSYDEPEYYNSDLWLTEESSDEESDDEESDDEESDDEESDDEETDAEESDDCCTTSKYHKTLQCNKDENKMSNSPDVSSDGEQTNIESNNDSPNCSPANTENIDNSDEINNLLESFVLI